MAQIKLLADKSFFRLSDRVTPAQISCQRILEHDGNTEIIGVDKQILYPGRNLCQDGIFSKADKWISYCGMAQIENNEATLTTNSTTSSASIIHSSTPSYFIAGEKYTLSVDIRSDTISFINQNYIMGSPFGGNNQEIYDALIITKEWKRVSRTFTANVTQKAAVGLGGSLKSGESVVIRNFKLECGDSATPFSAAPEDFTIKRNGDLYISGAAVSTAGLVEDQQWTLWLNGTEPIYTAITECALDTSAVVLHKQPVNFTINYENFVRQHLPSHKRQQQRIMLLRVFVSPLKRLFSEFESWRRQTRLEINMTGQVGVLQGYLRAKYNSDYISIAVISDAGLAVGLPFEGKLMAAAIGLPGEATAAVPLQGEARSQLGDVDFVVYVPAEFTETQIESLGIDIDRYKQALVKYKIIQ